MSESNGTSPLKHVELITPERIGVPDSFCLKFRDGAGESRSDLIVTTPDVAADFAKILDDAIESFKSVAAPAAAPAPGGRLEKLDHVSVYAVKTRGGRDTWRVSYRIPGYPRRTDRLGTDKAKAHRFAREVSEVLASVKARLIKPADAFRRLCVDRRPIEVHVAAYEKHLKTKKVVDDYRKSTLHRLREAIRLGDVAHYEHINRTAVERILEKLQQRGGSGEAATGAAGRGGDGDEPAKQERALAGQTINYYLKALKQFTKFMVSSGRASDNPIQHVGGIKAEEEGRRREASLEDVSKLYNAAIADKARRDGTMRGRDRGMLYITAFCTGLRADELRPAQVAWLQLDGERPSMIVPGEFTKNGQRAAQPLPSWLALSLKKWIGKRTGKLFPHMPADMCRVFERDLAAAKLEKQSDDGKLVFHSLRHGYASALLDSDAESKLVQALTRHSTITLLFDRYGHHRKNKAHQAVEAAMPNLISPNAKRARTTKETTPKVAKPAQRRAQRNKASVSGSKR